ncbi:50S ribosomal protein L2 [Candidatus Woesearchaeota archaeon]|nr:50S ribosomal protein L2 [Candidatus Woesearchaeota archaeon]
MGKRLIQQARGKGGPTYRAPSFRYKGKSKLPRKDVTGKIVDIVRCPGHSAPLFEVRYDDNTKGYLVASDNVRVGDTISTQQVNPDSLNVTELKNIPEGASIFNVEATPNDGGKFVRAGGTSARVITKLKDKVIVELPSKKQKVFHPDCRASIGIVAGGGRVEKPILKAGKKYYKMKAKNKLWPIVSGTAQNAVDHPFGNKRSSRKSKARPTSKNAPPGRKVGMIGARRTGRKKK